MYDAVADPYCYPGTTVLRNRMNLRDQDRLDAFEAEMANARANEPFPNGRASYSHYRAFHRHLFQDVYTWAGKIRHVRIAKGGSAFCYPEHIDGQMTALFANLRRDRLLTGLPKDDFATAGAHFLAELNAIHPFREGNGRTQLAFFTFLSEEAGHPLRLTRLDPQRFLAAMIASFSGDETPLEAEIRRLI